MLSDSFSSGYQSALGLQLNSRSSSCSYHALNEGVL
jgi:hypothetical protein